MKQQQQMWVRIEESWENPGSVKYSLSDTDMSKYGWLLLPDQITVEFEIPVHEDIRALKLSQLEKTKKELTAEFQARVTELQSQINELLAIEG
jgi:hypothetical protein